MNRQPNILFFFSDQHRGDWMPYGEDVLTQQKNSSLKLFMPNIKGMMERGTYFTNAYTPAAICAPARACLASGRRYRNCRVATNKVNYDTALPSFYKKLAENGYNVTGVGKFDLNKADLEWENGFHKTLREMGFTAALDSEGKMDVVWATLFNTPGPYGKMLQEKGLLDAYINDMSSRGNSPRVSPVPDELYADNWITQRAVDMLGSLDEDKPWFMQINFSGPHDPWDITQGMYDGMTGRVFPEAVDCPFAYDNLEVRRNYAAMIENIDRNIGLVLACLKDRKDSDNTLIVYASDHGEMMGDHGLYGKAKPYQASVHIPMVIDASLIDGLNGRCISSPVELQDLASTFLDYASAPYKDSLESISLRPIITGKCNSVRKYALSELINPNPRGLYKTFGTVTDGKYKLIIDADGSRKLFNIEDDPFEMEEISNREKEKVEELEKAFIDRGEKINPICELYASSFNAV